MQGQNFGPRHQGASVQNQGAALSIIELALIMLLIAMVVLAILLIIGDDLRLQVLQTIASFTQPIGS